MSNLKICKRCLYPSNHPFGLTFIGDICSGCYIHEEKYIINWDKRFSNLLEIVSSYKRVNKSYDCIIPITGGGDTYFTIEFVINKLGLKPLLVHYNNHFNTPVGIRNISNIANSFNCDLVSSVPSPSILKKISKTTFNNYGNFYWQAIAGYLTFPVQTATKYNIPLIIWGVNGWLDQVGMYSHLDSVEMSQRCREEHGLQGIKIKDILNCNINLKPNDFNSFIYPDNQKISKLNLRGIYLNNYIFWDSKIQHEKMIHKYNYETRSMNRTFNNYEDIGCLFANGSNDLLRYYKHGFSKVSDHVAREIRLKRLTVETGLKYILEYTKKIPNDIQHISDWLEIDKNEFYRTANKFKSKNYFSDINSEDSDYIKILKQLNTEELTDFKLTNIDKNINFRLTNNREFINENQNIMIGRCYTDKYNYGATSNSPKGSDKLI